MPKQNRGPYILAAGAAAQLLTGIPAAWGVFQQPVMQGYGFSRGQAMLAFAGGTSAAAKNPPASSAVPHSPANRGPRASCKSPPTAQPTP